MARLLLLEDSRVLHRFIEISLRGQDVTVEWSDKGLPGLESALEDPPDLIMLDLTLPEQCIAQE